MSESKYTPHVHAEVIKAWADGKTIEWRTDASMKWSRAPSPTFRHDYEYRVKPEEAVDYTIVTNSGIPCGKFDPQKDRILKFYLILHPNCIGFLKRTMIDGKVVSMEFIPK